MRCFINVFGVSRRRAANFEQPVGCIHFAGKPLGRPKQVTDANREQLKQEKAQRRQDYLQNIPIEGKFGQGKNVYRLNDIRAKRANTAFAWINAMS